MADQEQKDFVPQSGADLVHPVYLDIPMMTSFVAALEGGFAYADKRKTSRTASGGDSEIGDRTVGRADFEQPLSAGHVRRYQEHR